MFVFIKFDSIFITFTILNYENNSPNMDMAVMAKPP